MKRCHYISLAVLLALAMLAASAVLACAEMPQALDIIELDEIVIALDGAGEAPDDDGLALDGGFVLLDDGEEDGLALDGPLELQLSEDVLLDLTDGAEPGPLPELEGEPDADGVEANLTGQTESVTDSAGPDNDALFEAWMKRMLAGKASLRANRSALSGRASLEGVNLNLYDALVSLIREVAGGTRTNTEFVFSVDTIGLADSQWTAEQLGLESLNDPNMGKALLEKAGFSQSKILLALLADCPYDLYWFDKKDAGMGWSYGMQIKTVDGAKYARITSMTAKLAVAQAYSRADQVGTYEVNDLPARVAAAAGNIKSVISDNAGKDDLGRLRAYANAVCALAAYNSDAAGNPNTAYGDPWQLVYIFDGDTGTNVVCEGYAKAFKYLCDQSDFEGDVACELMSGAIPSGNHMWNALRMPDGRCYLVDLTNSDGGDFCNEKYFLRACGNRAGSSFTCGALTYTYNDNTLALFSDDWLTMSIFDYGDGYTVEDYTGEYDGQAHGILVSVKGAGTVAYGTAEGVYSDSDSPAWKDAGEYTVYFRVQTNGGETIEDRATVAITPKVVGLGWSDNDFTYDGDTHTPTATATGLVPGDACAVTVAGGQRDAGSYTATATGLSNANYALPANPTQVFTIARRMVGLGWSDTAFTYDGNDHAPAATATGLLPGDACAVMVAGEQRDAGNYTATATGLSNGNYALPTDATQAFVIEPKTVELKWTGTSLTYNGKTRKPTATATGLVPGDTCAVTVTGGRKSAGSYTARASGLSNGNYALPESAVQTCTIKPKTVGLKWTGTSVTYNGKARKPTATATGLIPGDKCRVTVTGGRKNAGSYTATATALSNANYALPKARTKACTVKKRTIALKWTNTRLKYNGKARKPTATASGLVKGDVCRVTVSGARTKKGTYTARATRLSNGNYRLPDKVTVKFSIY